MVVGLLALVVAIPASGFISQDEQFLYRWCSLVCGLGLGLFALGVAWVATIARVADPNLVAGVGAMFMAFAGITGSASVRAPLSEFDRKQVYT